MPATATKPTFKHIPKKGMFVFDASQFDGILKKISEFNNSLLSDLGFEEQLVYLSSLLYDQRLQDAYINSTDILESSIFTQQYADHVLENEREQMKCCRVEYLEATQSSQGIYYAVILLAEILESMKNVAKFDAELSVEQQNLLSVGYKNVIGARRASWRIMSSIEEKVESKGNESYVNLIKG